MSLIISSLLSLIIGTIVGLTQSRIKRLYAFSTISHLGFILLALTINSIESIQAFLFYLMQYSISNLNAFMLIIVIGYSLYFYDYYNKTNELNVYLGIDPFINFIYNKSMDENNEHNDNNNLQDIKNSPLQLIDQLKGYYYINPILSLSLAITLFSFVGIPPLIGFFAKQMVLSAAIDNGYIFMSLVAILTSVISAVYYLAIIKQIFFDTPDYNPHPVLEDYINLMQGVFINKNNLKDEEVTERDLGLERALGFNQVSEKDTLLENIKLNDLSSKDFINMYSDLAERILNIEAEEFTIRKKDVFVSSSLSLPISVLTLIIGLFIFIPEE
jgi:NADH:ubiquinone oxidoreductase subunit 5 (subunit L)/multisubunit Na+/H+ antiporter MnhA subunit